jgi:hypothetical protein
MDPLRFDHLTRLLAGASPRRGVLTRLAALSLSLAVTLPGLPEPGAAAKRRRQHHRRTDRRNHVSDEKKRKKKTCAKAGQPTSKKRKKCCQGLVKDGAGRCAQPATESCAATCDGCCQGETCVPGTSAEACGAGGIPCGVCGAEAPTCLAGACRDCDVCPSGCGFASVQAAITAASPGDTIRICPGTYRENLTIDRKLTLRGSGQGTGAGDTILQGVGSGRVVTIPDNEQTVKLQHLRITGGVATGGSASGGGISNLANLLTIEDCTITGNSAEGLGGGGLFNEGGSRVVMQRCTVSDNSVPDLFTVGGGIRNRGQLTLIECTVNENRMLNGSGGGMGNEGTLRLQSCSVRQNTAHRGAGIWNTGTVNIELSDVTANSAPSTDPDFGGPGGIRNGGVMTITDSTVSGNTTGTSGGGIDNFHALVLDNSSVTGNSAAIDGGGVINRSGGSVTLQNDSSVSDNTPNNCLGSGFSGPGCEPD